MLLGCAAAWTGKMFALRLTTRRYLLIALLVVPLATAAAPAARASSGASVISDCIRHLRLTHTYTIAELNNALHTLPADAQEYSNCKDVIQRALLAKEGRKLPGGGVGSVGSSSSGSALPTPLIVILVVLVLAAVTLAAVAIRRRRS